MNVIRETWMLDTIIAARSIPALGGYEVVVMKRHIRVLIVVLAAVVALLALAWALDKTVSSPLQVSTPLAPHPQAEIRTEFYTREIAPALAGKVTGVPKPFIGKRSLKSSFLTQPTPDVWLEFPSTLTGEKSDIATPVEGPPVVKVQLSSKAKRVLREQWKVICTYYYLELTDKKDADLRAERFRYGLRAHLSAGAKLMETDINAPDGRRKISHVEAAEILGLLKEFAEKMFLPISEEGKDIS